MKRRERNNQTDSENKTKECFNYTGPWPHTNKRKSCPAWGCECRNFGKKNHYEKMCKTLSRKVKRIDNPNSSNSDTDSEDEYQVKTVKKSKANTTVTARINTVPLQFQIDSGADVNIIDENSFDKLKGQVCLTKTKAKLFSYNSRTPLPLLGKFTATVSTKKRYEA